MNERKTGSSVLLVDDEQSTLDSFSLALNSEGIVDVGCINDSRRAMSYILEHDVSVVVLDLSMPHMTGLELLTEIKREAPDLPVIMMTAANDMDTAIGCMKQGAFDYLVKPVEHSRFFSSIRKALKMKELHNEISALSNSMMTGRLRNEGDFSSIVTRCSKMTGIFRYIEAIAGSSQPILITGETGTGKTLLAEAVHRLSKRTGRFIAVNVAGLDNGIFSDTLFGHEKGAFTGAEKRREGMVAQASEGTLFLDEIGDLTETSQIKLLQLLQEQLYYQLGSDVPRRSSACVIVATNKPLAELTSGGRLRKDLYYRLSTHHIHIPPLRERGGDVHLLTGYFLDEAARALGKKRVTAPPELFTLLANYSFPGNVRELQAMVFDAVARNGSAVLSMKSFRDAMQHSPSSMKSSVASSADEKTDLNCSFSRFPTLREIEDHFIEEALTRSGGNISMAASMLGISRQALSKRVKKGTS